MAIVIKFGRKPVKKVKTEGSQKVLDRLERYLQKNVDEPVEMLCSFWDDQRNAISYKELREAVQNGSVSEETFKLWQQDYSVLVRNQLSKVWTNAMVAGSTGPPVMDGLQFEFNTQTPGVIGWISERGAEFVTSCTMEQREAIASLLTKKMVEGHTVDELARLIRPCIGLTEGQAKANAKFYDSMVSSMRKEHPRMKTESIRRKALDASQRYAERQHRQRAFDIAQTEMAFAYNRGADEGIRQAQSKRLLPAMKKRWSTSGDDGVCETCSSLEGMEIDLDSEFDFKGRTLFRGHHRLPPAHPRCACAIEYIEAEPGVIPKMEVSITQSDSFREYTDEEIISMSKQTEDVVTKHIDIPSKWSGTMHISDDGFITEYGRKIEYGKLWDCRITTKHETAPGIIMHEQIHARSASYFNEKVYSDNYNIEEASVQFMTQEISKVENIEIIESAYDDMVEVLRKIGNRISDKSDYAFAKELIEVPLEDRLQWLSDKMYATMGMDTYATIEEYMEFSELLNLLY